MALDKKSQRLLALAERLIQARAELDAAETAFTAETETVGDTVALGDQLSEAQKALAFISAQPSKTFSAVEIAKAIGVENVQNVRSILARAATANKIVKVDRGEYQALQPDVLTLSLP